ncbi:hypothetical protein OG755_00815 [Streptomyces sp. NBC_01443]|nr:hypothetical protein [Streptomyces sp. NBC_01443]MCX4625283.1 hypothetical protein [Streptomyces sp. NBC_01443]
MAFPHRDLLGGCGDSFPESGQFHGRTTFGSFEEGVSEVRFESVELDRQGRVVDAEVLGCFGAGGWDWAARQRESRCRAVWAGEGFAEDGGKSLGFVTGA